MIDVCKNIDGCWTNIDSPDIVQGLTYREYSETRKRELSSLKGLKKNIMRNLRHSTSKLLRQEDTSDTGFILRRCTNISGVGNPSCQVPEMWKSEAREDRLDIRQSLLHETFFLLCGTKMPFYDHSRCLQRIEIRLAYSQDI